MKKLLILITLLVLTSSCEIKLEERSGWLIEKKYKSLLGPSFVISNPTDIEDWKIIIVQEYTYQKYNVGDTIK